MSNLEHATFIIALVVSGLAAFMILIATVFGGKNTRSIPRNLLTTIARAGFYLQIVALLALTASFIIRWLDIGHGPFSNMYEFTVAFAWGVLLVGFLFRYRYHSQTVNTTIVMFAFVLLIIASRLNASHISLMPSLQNSWLLTTHVATAVVAYGCFTTAFAAAVAFLWKSRKGNSPATETLEDIYYHAVIIGFPFMTLVIILGALWADVAWGRYWGWDPKETASLVTWLIYAGYLHTRLVRGWRGRKAAILLVIGFLAVLFTFFGNYIFSGLHSYG